MTVRGRVSKGKVLLDNPKAIPEGTEVEVRPARKRKPASTKRKTAKKVPPRSLTERLAKVIGTVNLPPDASVNVDHYLYGLPKKR